MNDRDQVTWVRVVVRREVQGSAEQEPWLVMNLHRVHSRDAYEAGGSWRSFS